MFTVTIERHDGYRVRSKFGGTWQNVKKMAESLGTILHAKDDRGRVRVRYSDAHACPSCGSTGLHKDGCEAAPSKPRTSLMPPRTEAERAQGRALRPRRGTRIKRPE